MARDMLYVAFIALSIVMMLWVAKLTETDGKVSKTFLWIFLLAFAFPLALLGSFRSLLWVQLVALGSLSFQVATILWLRYQLASARQKENVAAALGSADLP